MHGAAGIDELSPAGPNLVAEVVRGQVIERTIDPLELGIPRCDPAELRGGSPDENAAAIRRVFEGANGGASDAILLNAAGAIAAAGHADDLREALELARKTVASGAAGGAARRARGILAGRWDALATPCARPGLGVIAEFKRRSPRQASSVRSADPVEFTVVVRACGSRRGFDSRRRAVRRNRSAT